MQCQAITTSGEQCKRDAVEGSRFCAIPSHQKYEAQEEKPKEEPTIMAMSLHHFKDGGLREAFEKEGLSYMWPKGQKRTISIRLYKLCLNSGARFEVIV